MMIRLVDVDTAIELLRVFWPDLVEVDGSVFLAWERPKKTSDPDLRLDRTGMEAFVNHMHMIDLFSHNAGCQPDDKNDDRFYDNKHPDFLMLCQLGKTVAKMWFQKLKTDFPDYDFRVYYTQEDNPIVRFHRVRPDEPVWLDDTQSNEAVEQGKIIIYDTRQESAKPEGA